MKKLLSAMLAATRDNTAPPARAGLVVGLVLIVIFALAGMITTAQFWIPIALAAVLLATGWLSYKQYRKRIPQERKRLLVSIVSQAMAFSLQRELPYAFDRATSEELAHKVTVIRENDVDIVTAVLLTLEPNPHEMDMRLLAKIFRDRLAILGASPGLGATAYCSECSLLALVGMELIGQDLTIRVLFADTRAAVFYWKKLESQRLEAAKNQMHPHKPPHKTEFVLKDGDVI